MTTPVQTQAKTPLLAATLKASQFVHVAGRSLNLAHVVQCLWEADGSATVCVCGLPDLKLTGPDRDLLAEALCLPGPEELKVLRDGARDRLAAAQKSSLDDANATKAAKAAKGSDTHGSDTHGSDATASGRAKP